MTKFNVERKNLAHICLFIVWSYSLITVEGRRPTCPQPTHFTIFYPSNPEKKETCRICPICPPGHGLPLQCGNRVANGTSTDCKPCANGTYSKTNDSSECKSCDKCEGRYVLQQCSSRNNSKCGTCLPGYYLDPDVDDCKECFFCCDDVPEDDHLKECKDLEMPWNMQCEATDENKKCKFKAILLNRTTTRPITTVSPLSNRTGAIGSTGSAIAPSGITANNSTTKNASKLHPNPINETEIINESVSEDSGSSGGKRCAALAACGILLVITIAIISYVAVRKIRQSEHKDQLSNIDEQESLDANNEETTGRDNRNLLRIPEDCLVSDMEKLHDNNQVMFHSVQKKLDARETLQQKTWRGVGMALGLSSEDLDLIETCYISQQSPTEALVLRLKNRSYGEPSMREFVRALITCERGDVARIIINWPRWEMTSDLVDSG